MKRVRNWKNEIPLNLSKAGVSWIQLLHMVPGRSTFQSGKTSQLSASVVADPIVKVGNSFIISRTVANNPKLAYKHNQEVHLGPHKFLANPTSCEMPNP